MGFPTVRNSSNDTHIHIKHVFVAHLVRFGNVSEYFSSLLFLRLTLAALAIRVVQEGSLPVGLLDLVLVRSARYPQQLGGGFRRAGTYHSSCSLRWIPAIVSYSRNETTGTYSRERDHVLVYFFQVDYSWMTVPLIQS